MSTWMIFLKTGAWSSGIAGLSTNDARNDKIISGTGVAKYGGHPHKGPMPDKSIKMPGEREFIVMMAATMALNALAIDSMLPAFPAMAKSLGVANLNNIQPVISIYLLGLGIGSLVYGPLSDRFGRKPVLLIPIIGYALFSLICSMSDSLELLLAMRFCHGFMSASLGVLVVSIIRDRFSGDAMARRMSTIFLIFMVVPVLAPTMGQTVLLFSGWHTIFDVMAGMALMMAIWIWLRLPETLHPENIIPIQHRSIFSTWKEVVLHRQAAGYVIGSGLAQGALFGFLNSAQQVFDQVFHARDFFPIGFAIIGAGLATANFTNSRIVERFGARRVSHSALLLFIFFALAQLAVSYWVPHSLPLFLGLLTINMAMMGFIGSNFSSIAMTPFGAKAGAASSFQMFARTVIAAGFGAGIGHQFNGTVTPLASGFLISGLITLSLVLWCEKGKLFTRPGTTQPAPL